MIDMAEDLRRAMLAKLNDEAERERADLTLKYGQVWDTTELQRDFTVEGFMAPFVVVRRKADGVRGTLTFQHSPRFYFDFTPE